MKQYLELGSVPCNEECVQVSKTKEHLPAMKKECLRYLSGLVKKYPDMGFKIMNFAHALGNYCEVVIYYDDSDEEMMKKAYDIENNLPQTWEELEN